MRPPRGSLTSTLPWRLHASVASGGNRIREGHQAFAIRARFPWQGRPQTRVMIEVTVDESIMLPPQRRRVIHQYGEPLDVGVQVYPL